MAVTLRETRLPSSSYWYVAAPSLRSLSALSYENDPSGEVAVEVRLPTGSLLPLRAPHSPSKQVVIVPGALEVNWSSEEIEDEEDCIRACLSHCAGIRR